jgi:hypothetical protein
MIARSLLVFIALVAALFLVLPVVAVGLVFVAVAGFVRLAESTFRSGPQPGPWRDLVQYEPDIGWRPRPNLDSYATADDRFHLTTGPDGWRGQTPIEDADVVVFGDSFSFGHGADDDAMYTAFCDDLRVKAIGSDGYNMVHGLLWMKRLAPKLSGKLVVWFVYYGNDLHENILPAMGRYRMPYLAERPDQRGWEVVTDHVSPEPWLMPTPKSYHPVLAELCCDTHFSKRVFAACEHLIAEVNQICNHAGARLVIAGIPDRVQLTRPGRAKLATLAPQKACFDPAYLDNQMGLLCRGQDVSFVPMSDRLSARDYLVHDIHWRRTGHQKAARLLKEVHRQAPASGTPPLDASTWSGTEAGHPAALVPDAPVFMPMSA